MGCHPIPGPSPWLIGNVSLGVHQNSLFWCILKEAATNCGRRFKLALYVLRDMQATKVTHYSDKFSQANLFKLTQNSKLSGWLAEGSKLSRCALFFLHVAPEKVTRIRLDLPQFKYLPRISEPVFSLHYFLFFSLKTRLNFFGEALLWGATLVGAWKRIVPRGIGMIFMFFILSLKGFLDCRWSNLADLSSALGSVWKLTPVCRKWTWAPAI